MEAVETVEWTVRERVAPFVLQKQPGSFYWNVFIKYQSPEGTHREFVLESGILNDKVAAFTQARKRARHYRGEKHRALRGIKGGPVPGMKGWK